MNAFLRRFFATESAGGLVMIACAAFALLLANGPFADTYASLSHTLHFSVNDVAMTLFFFVVGMELKYEVKEGLLSQRGQVALPLIAAIAGMAAPAAIFLLCVQGHPEYANGWAIPSATDIAFALAILTLFGRSVPASVKLFLLAIAIFDDLGAILIIAAYYSHDITLAPLLCAALCMAALYMLQRREVGYLSAYALVGVVLWYCLYKGGIHTTLAGVITGVSIPLKSKQGDVLERSMHRLHPWSNFLVLPLFALINAGVPLHDFNLPTLLSPLPLGVALGLFLGKQLGIFTVTYGLIKTRLVAMPQDAHWGHIYGASVLAGIGFTMSIFIGNLAFSSPEMVENMKIGVLAGTFFSSIFGAIVLKSAK